MATYSYCVTYRNVETDERGRIGYYDTMTDAHAAMVQHRCMGVQINLQLWEMIPTMRKVGDEFLCRDPNRCRICSEAIPDGEELCAFDARFTAGAAR